MLNLIHYYCLLTLGNVFVDAKWYFRLYKSIIILKFCFFIFLLLVYPLGFYYWFLLDPSCLILLSDLRWWGQYYSISIWCSTRMFACHCSLELSSCYPFALIDYRRNVSSNWQWSFSWMWLYLYQSVKNLSIFLSSKGGFVCFKTLLVIAWEISISWQML